MLPIERAMLLLEDCRRLGTLAFAHAARAGFVATTFLKSFRRLGIFTAERELDFMSSVATVAKTFEQAKQDYAAGRKSKQDLVTEFGHLRPGTYEIEVPA